MAKGTYIYLDRGVLDHWTYEDKPFNKSMAWIDLLLIADHTTHTTIWRGKPTEFKRGDVNISITQLAKRWGWSRDKVRRYISQLEQDNMVRANCTTNKTTITIVKYEDFQNKRATGKATDKATKRASDNTTDATHLSNNKGIKKEIKESGSTTSYEVTAAEEEEETPPVEGAVKMANGGWDYCPDIEWDDDE